MNLLDRRRTTAALVAAAALTSLATSAAPAGAEPDRTATTTSYTHADYLHRALGIPEADTSIVIESVTYDRFQYLLQQPGRFAFLIGDPATDATFAQRAQDVEAAASTAGVSRVYWFNPNLSGNAVVGGVASPNLDIRNPAGITALDPARRVTYGQVWQNVVGKYLGNGITSVQNQAGTQSATVTITASDKVNDPGGAEVGNAASEPLFDYDGDADDAAPETITAPADAQDSFFVVYDKDREVNGRAAKVSAWVNLTEEADTASTTPKVTTAIGVAASITRLDSFSWWKSEANSRQKKQAPEVHRGGNIDVVTEDDNDPDAGGWRVDQITYPELVDLLEHADDGNAVILFGGTWCPNTRAVLKQVNRFAQRNDVRVFNFDTVLDGGIVGGGTTARDNPLQSRNHAQNASGSIKKNTPSFLYGQLLSQYLTNIDTEYQPTGTNVTYWPGGQSSDDNPANQTVTVRRLQVPFVLGYQGAAGAAPNAGVKRQWLSTKADNSTLEHMSQWYWTNPQPFQINIAASALPKSTPIWAKVNAQLADFTWKTDPASVYANTGTTADAAEWLIPADQANVTVSGSPADVSVTSSASGTVAVGPAELKAALKALGATAPATYSAARTAFLEAYAADQGSVLTGRLRTVVGAWGVVASRKGLVNGAWGTRNSPGSIAGGIRAVHDLDVFFGGLPGPVVARRTVTANAVTAGTAPTIDLAVANDHGRTPTGDVTLQVTRGDDVVHTATRAIADHAVSFTLPTLGEGTYGYELAYATDGEIAGFTETGSLKVDPKPADPPVQQPPVVTPPVVTPPTPAPAVTPPASTTKTPSKVKLSKIAGALVKSSTRKYKVTFTAPKGGAAPTGRVTVKLKKGSVVRTVTGRLSRGAVTVKLPKLARGTWKVTISWPGDANYTAASRAGNSLKVTK